MNTNPTSALGKFLRNFSYAFVANLIQMAVSAIIVLIIPKFFGVDDYGYWQLYLLYFSYVGSIQLGWCDGVYLRYSGKEYKDLDGNLFASQLGYLIIFYLLVSSLLVFSVNLFFGDVFNLAILIFTLLSGLMTTPRGLLFYVLQGTNRITEFAKMNMLEKISFISLLLLFFVMGFRSFESIILADILGKLLSLLGTVYYCRDIVFKKWQPLKTSIKEAYENINAGIKLMVANIASSLIIGIVRFSIEQAWGLEVFGKISLTLTISNLVMIFINSVGVVIFPVLKRVSHDRLSSLYTTIRNLLMALLFFSLVFYYPIKVVLSYWLPQYAESLNYMALLFPLVIFESKTSLLINTYLKALRKEKNILYINVSTVLLSLITTYFTITVLDSLTSVIVSIVLLLAVRSITAELFISKLLNISVNKDIFFEISLTVIFMLSSWNIRGILGLLIYMIFYAIYIFLKKGDIKQSIQQLKSINK